MSTHPAIRTETRQLHPLPPGLKTSSTNGDTPVLTTVLQRRQTKQRIFDRLGMTPYPKDATFVAKFINHVFSPVWMRGTHSSVRIGATSQQISQALVAVADSE